MASIGHLRGAEKVAARELLNETGPAVFPGPGGPLGVCLQVKCCAGDPLFTSALGAAPGISRRVQSLLGF